MEARWRRFSRGVQALVALVVAAGCSTLPPGPPPADPGAADLGAIDRLFREYDSLDAPGAAVAVVHGGRVAFVRGYGVADLETKRRITDRTNFRLASLTKPITALAVMMLADEGRLRLDDAVGDVLPDFPRYGRDVRIRHLLTHTSGLRPYQDLLGPSPRRQLADRDVLALLRHADGLMFRPGAAFRYSDSGYAVLALVIEAVSGRPFTQFLEERIFAPAGMTSTVVRGPAGPAVPYRALGYARTARGFQLSDQSATSTVRGDGGIYSSIRDLLAWDRALDAQTLVDARWQRRAWTSATLADGRTAPYGLGWFVDRDADGGFVVWHHGETTGFTNFILKHPERRLTVVVLTNRQGGSPGDIAAAIAALPAFRSPAR